MVSIMNFFYVFILKLILIEGTKGFNLYNLHSRRCESLMLQEKLIIASVLVAPLSAKERRRTSRTSSNCCRSDNGGGSSNTKAESNIVHLSEAIAKDHASRSWSLVSSSKNDHFDSRRNCIGIITGGGISFFLGLLSTPPNMPLVDGSSYQARAISLPFLHTTDFVLLHSEPRRQLELCLTTIQRVCYWSERVGSAIRETLRRKDHDDESVTMDLGKAPYLEARLGAKAALTGKVGGGANSQVYNMATWQLRGCVKDVIRYYQEYDPRQFRSVTLSTSTTPTKDEQAQWRRQRVLFDNAVVEITESLAAVVEFDGLDNIQDPSPRSSLTLNQYTDQKAQFVQRTLLERTVPACKTVVGSFGTEKKILVEKFILANYPNEVPKPKLTIF